MAAYIISRVIIVDRDSMARYMAEAPQTVNAFGGRYLVRGNDVRALEGAWDHERMVVVEFPDKLPRSRGTPPRSTGRCVISGSGAPRP